jgi:hypothetical protein
MRVRPRSSNFGIEVIMLLISASASGALGGMLRRSNQLRAVVHCP